MDMILSVSPTGRLKAIYHDDLRALIDQGEARITRASAVEPDEAGKWWADMSLSGFDIKLGPYDLREDALKAERAFLEAKMFGVKDRA